MSGIAYYAQTSLCGLSLGLGCVDVLCDVVQPRELTLCRVFEDMGRCPLVGCEFAHGHEELAQREKEFECALSLL